MSTRINTDIIELNMGPQHPSTHGVLRLILKLDGEVVKECKPDLGYLHRGIEKLAESHSYIQFIPLTDPHGLFWHQCSVMLLIYMQLKSWVRLRCLRI